MTHGKAPHTGRRSDEVAAELRRRILNGELGTDGHLATQDVLATEHGVSTATIREALMILETEGLVRVHRGRRGGAGIYLPAPKQVGYQTALVLHRAGTTLADVGAAIRELEPLCAALCAEREDRHTTVVPVLEDALKFQRAQRDDWMEFHRAARRFHEAVSAGCGNATLTLMVGTLEGLWSLNTPGRISRSEGSFDDQQGAILTSLRTHDKTLRAIATGDPARAAAVTRSHLEAVHALVLAVAGKLCIDANLNR